MYMGWVLLVLLLYPSKDMWVYFYWAFSTIYTGVFPFTTLADICLRHPGESPPFENKTMVMRKHIMICNLPQHKYISFLHLFIVFIIVSSLRWWCLVVLLLSLHVMFSKFLVQTLIVVMVCIIVMMCKRHKCSYLLFVFFL